MLNIPEPFEQEVRSYLPEGKKILLMGVGGGFDILSCLPLYHTLRMKGFNLELANFSMVKFDLLHELTDPIILSNNVYGATSTIKAATEHYPEGYLSAWFKEGFEEDVTVWMLQQQSVPDMVDSLRLMIEKLDIGLIILCGAGSKSIMTGEEEGCGEIFFPSIVLAAIRYLENTRSLLFVMGVNTSGGRKAESMLNAMEGVQALIMADAYYGGCTMDKRMDCFKYYKSAYEYIVDQQHHQKSPIHEMIITAIYGGFGPHKEYGGFICPELYQGHFFDAVLVSNYNILIPHIETIPEYDELLQRGLGIANGGNKRPREVIPA